MSKNIRGPGRLLFSRELTFAFASKQAMIKRLFPIMILLIATTVLCKNILFK
jgi:hypothetical protein